MTRATPGRRGFTLFEMMAVVLIMGLLFTFAMPNLDFMQRNALWSEARELGGQLALARQQAVVTGKPHRVLIDLEAGTYRVEWYVSNDEAEGLPPAPPPELDPNAPLDLAPPGYSDYAYRPIPFRVGNDTLLDPRFYFDGVESSGEWVKEGLAQIVFERDGSADPSEIVITDSDGFAVALEVSPLLETVKIHDEFD